MEVGNGDLYACVVDRKAHSVDEVCLINLEAQASRALKKSGAHFHAELLIGEA